MAPALVNKIAHALHLDHKHKDERKEGQSASVPPITVAEPAPETANVASTDAATPKPVFDSSKVTVVFVLGGPGAGKGTQCARLVDTFDFCHLSAGDLLRAEQDRPGSDYGDLIRTYIKEGKIVPMEVTVKLLENAMRAAIDERGKAADRPLWAEGKGRFLVDGFPRKMDQADKFEQDVCRSSLVIFYTTTEEVMLKRLLKRGETSGRDDDNEESIKKRFVTYHEQTMPVIEHYRALNKVAEIDSSPSVDEVQVTSAEIVKKLFEKSPGAIISA